MVVWGPAGIGKSVVIAQWVEQAGDAARFIRRTGHVSEALVAAEKAFRGIPNFIVSDHPDSLLEADAARIADTVRDLDPRRAYAVFELRTEPPAAFQALISEGIFKEVGPDELAFTETERMEAQTG